MGLRLRGNHESGALHVVDGRVHALRTPEDAAPDAAAARYFGAAQGQPFRVADVVRAVAGG